MAPASFLCLAAALAGAAGAQVVELPAVPRPALEAAPAGSASDSWQDLAGWLDRSFGWRLEPEAWKRETALRLRENPGEPLERALAVAATKAGLEASEVEALERGLSRDFETPVLETQVMGTLRGAAEHRGILYVAANGWGLYQFDGSKAVREQSDGSAAFEDSDVRWVGVADGGLHLATGRRIYKRLAEGWQATVELPDIPEITAAAKLGERWYLGSQAGVTIVEGRSLLPRLPSGQVVRLETIGGRVVALTPEGARVVSGTQVERLETGSDLVYFVKELRGRTYIGTERGLFTLGEGGLNRELIGTGAVVDLAEHDGGLLAATDEGMYFKGAGLWRRASRPGRYHQRIHVYRGKVYLLEQYKLSQWTPKPPERVEGYKKDVLTSLVPELERLSRKPGVERAALREEKDQVIGQGGRTIFSGRDP